MIDQGVGDKGLAVGEPDLPHVPGVGTQQRDLAPAHVRRQQQTVERIVLRFAVPDPAEQIFEDRPDAMDIDHRAGVRLQREIVNPDRLAVAVVHFERMLAHHPEPQVVENRHHIGQRNRLVRVEQLEVQRALVLFQRPVETHRQIVRPGCGGNVLQIDGGPAWREHVGVTGRETARPQTIQLVAGLFAVGFTERLVQAVAPGLSQLDDLFPNLRDGQLAVLDLGHANGELNPGQHRLREVGNEFDVFGVQAVQHHLLDFQTQLGVVDVSGEERQTGHELAIDIFAHEQLDAAPLLDVENVFGDFQQLVGFDLEQLIAGIEGQDLLQFLARVVVAEETGTLHHALDLAPQQRDFVRPLVVNPRRVQAEEAPFADHLAFAVELLDRDVIRVGRAVNPGTLRRLGEDENVVAAGHFLASALRQLVQPDPFRTLVVNPEDAQLGVRHPAHGNTVLVLGKIVFVVAEEGKVIGHQPVQECLGFFLLFLADAGGGGVQFGDDFTDLVFDNRKIGDRNAHFVQHFLQRLFQLPEIGGVAVAVDFQHDKGLVAGPGTAGLGRVQFLELARLISVDVQDGVLDGVGADFTLVNGDAQ